MEGLRGFPGRPHPLLVLPVAGGGTVRLWPSRGPSEEEWSPRGPVEIRLPPVCRSARRVDVPAAVYARILPKVPLAAAGGSSGLPGVERTLSGMVHTRAELVLPWFARRRTINNHGNRKTIGVDDI